ncbi:MAG: Ig-like domain-containing protein, partial [Pirellulaceae bacterium]
GKSLRYTPARDFGGTEFFTYTVADASGEQSSAQVTLHTLPGDQADDDIQIQLVATDLNGNPISAVQQGDDFRIELRVDDLRFSSANTGTAAGVFAAYTDLLYSRQLVSTIPNSDANSNFPFEVSFFNDYLNFQTGDATVPGIVEEFGAFSNRTVMNDPDPTLLATITFNARSAGIADFTPDPADNTPFSDSLLFDTPGSAVPVERIRYTGTQLEIVGDGVEFPVAVDDSLPSALPENSIRFPIDVLANDLPGSTGSITIVSSTNGLFGNTIIDARGTSDPSDDRVLYTPNGGFNGADQFTYTIQDARGIQSTATVTVRVGDADSDDIVSLRLSVTDLSGQVVDTINVGDQFQLRGFVQDLRGFGIDRGIFAAYEDVLYNSTLVSPVLSNTNDPDLGFQVQFGPNYQRVREGDVRTAGVINEIGAVQVENGNQPLGSAEQLLFVVTLTANSTGVANFIADPADIAPLHDTLTFEPPAAVPFDQIRYGFDSVNIVNGDNGGGSGEFFLDVNKDDFISPLDALLVMNELNRNGSGASSGEGESGGNNYDTTRDGFITPLDALVVINFLNNGSAGVGEGESVASLSVPALSPTAMGMVGGNTGIEPVVLEVLQESKNEIGARDTGMVYGPALESFATDSIFDDADEDLDALLTELAPGIDESWKKDLS